jgi:hypothetical protein
MQICIAQVAGSSILWQVNVDGAKVGSPGAHPWGARRNALAALRDEHSEWRKLGVKCAMRREAALAYALLRS